MKWMNQLTASEKKLLKIGFLLVMIALSWVLIYQPIKKSLNTKSIKRNELSQQYQQMLSSQDVITNQNIKTTNFQRNRSKPFITWIDEQLEKNNLSQFVTRSEPKDNKTLILTFESIVFDDLIKWIEPLESNYGILITEVDINLLDRNNGLCNTIITLEE